MTQGPDDPPPPPPPPWPSQWPPPPPYPGPPPGRRLLSGASFAGGLLLELGIVAASIFVAAVASALHVSGVTALVGLLAVGAPIVVPAVLMASPRWRPYATWALISLAVFVIVGAGVCVAFLVTAFQGH